MPIIGLLIGGISSFFRGLFGLKQAQADVISQAIQVAGSVNSVDAQQMQAAGNTVASEGSSQNILASSWRPLLMYIAMGIIVSHWFGYAPSHISDTDLQLMYHYLDIGLVGYMPLRTLEKIISQLGLGPIIKEFIAKKLA